MKAETAPLYPPESRTILHVAECYEGGVGRAIRNIARITPHHTHLLLARGAAVQDDMHLFHQVLELPSNHLRAISTVQLETRKLKPDVVHAHSSWAGLYTRLLPLPYPVVYEPHCYAFEDNTRSAPFRAAFWLAEHLVSYRTSSVLTLSRREAALAARLNTRMSVHSLPNIPTLPVVSPSQAAARPFTRSVYMIGRAAPQKDPEYFIKVAREVRRRLDNVEFVWVGDGEPSLLQLLQRHEIRVTGWLDSARMAQVLGHAGTYVHSASYEGFPLSVLDAASQGVPVIARKIPCFEETPLICAATPKILAEIVVEALTNIEKRNAIIARGYELLTFMNEHKQVEALQRAYAENRS